MFNKHIKAFDFTGHQIKNKPQIPHKLTKLAKFQD